MTQSLQASKIQKLIGKRMAESKRTKPCFYLSAKADVTDLLALRPKLRKQLNVKVTTNCFYIKCLAIACEQYARVLAMIEGDNLKIPEEINIGFAVNAPQGLIVPVLKKANQKSLADIAHEEKLFTNKARDNELQLEELEGETVALSYLGPYDIDSFVAIVPPQTSCILAVGNIAHQMVPLDGEIVERRLVSLTLAADHCVINPEYAAKFLSYFKELLEKPQQVI